MKATCCLGQKTAFNQNLPPEMITMTGSLTSHVISHSWDIKNTTNVKDARILGWLCETIAKVPKLGCRPNDMQIIKSNGQDTDRLDSFPEKPKDRTNWTCPYYCTKWKNTREKKKIHHFACHISKWFPIFMCIQRSISMKWLVRDNSSSPPKVRLNSFPIKFKPY